MLFCNGVFTGVSCTDVNKPEIRSKMNVAILSLLLLGCFLQHCDCLPRK